MSKTINFKMENCYGIKSLLQEFTFEDTRKAHLVYASNGVFKTSFLKSLEDYSVGNSPIDRFDNNVKGIVRITDETGVEVDKDSVICFPSIRMLDENNFFDTDLLISKNLKKEYVEVQKQLNMKETTLIEGVHRTLTGKAPKQLATEEIYSWSKTYSGSDDFIEALRLISEEAEKYKPSAYVKQEPMVKILNKDNIDILNKGTVKNDIANYAEVLSKLLTESGFLTEDFNNFSFKKLCDSLRDGKFFEAGHKLVLVEKATKRETVFTTIKELEDYYNETCEKILKSKEANESFAAISNAVGNSQKSITFTKLIKENLELATALNNIDKLKDEYYIFSFKESMDNVKSLIEYYDTNIGVIDNLKSQIKIEETLWQEAIQEFNSRFSLPFSLGVANLEDVVLKQKAPRVSYQYGDVSVTKEGLFQALSDGERKALYLLEIIFSIKQLEVEQRDLLLVFDDVVDSFGYINKYAFIEYFQDFLRNNKSYAIVLTHNFDFLRTLASRSHRLIQQGDCHIAEARSQSISIESIDVSKGPLELWRDDCDTDNAKFIASIPFVRELHHLKDRNHDYNPDLSNVLHGRTDGDAIDVDLIRNHYLEQLGITLIRSNQNLRQLILSEADRIIAKENNSLLLEEKIVLSMGTRILVEIFLNNIYTNETGEILQYGAPGKLWGKCCDLTFIFSEEQKTVVQQMLLMTTENIHINSFMYEPLVDIGSNRLLELYTSARNL